MFKNIFIQRIFPLIISLLFSYYIVITGLLTISNTDTCATKLVNNNIKKTFHYSNYKKNNSVEGVVSAIKSKNTILLVGSSEMGTAKTDIAARPDLFFQKYKTKFSVVTLGHDGNQCMSIYTQLLVFSKYLKNSKISVIVSPGWFEGHFAYGTSLDRFLEYNNENFINEIYSNIDIPYNLKNYVSKYIYEKYNDLISPSILYKSIACNYKADLNFLNKIALTPLLKYYKITKNNNILPAVNETLIVDYDINNCDYGVVNWDSLYIKAIKHQKEISTNNTWGIYNDYYTNRTKGKTSKERVIAVNKNRELKDFKKVLELFKYYNVDASFIIQPLNPYAYSNLIDYKPILSEVEKTIKEYNYPYINLFVYDTAKYKIGTLTDVMHFGEYGWLKADKFLIDTYEK